MKVFSNMLQVNLKGVSINVPFLIFPHSNNNETLLLLLGIDFIRTAGVVIDFYQEAWYFSENHETKYRLLFEPLSRVASCASTDILQDDEGPHLHPAEREALAGLLVQHSDIFKAGRGPTPYAELRIDTGDHSPIAVPPYGFNHSKKELMETEINKMLQDDIIEECESAWCSPALLVPKANGSVRFCVDYRRLNAVTKSDSYPMPRIDELLQGTKMNCFMTFGLKNAPACFQRLID